MAKRGFEIFKDAARVAESSDFKALRKWRLSCLEVWRAHAYSFEAIRAAADVQEGS
jgi:hypothetical protein